MTLTLLNDFTFQPVSIISGIDAPKGSRSYQWHLGRFLYTKDEKKVRILSDKAWVTVRTTKKLVEM
jgi:hypothetical protein